MEMRDSPPSPAEPSTSGRQEPNRAEGGLWAHLTLVATMSEATARTAGLREGDVVAVAGRHAW